MYFHFSIEDDFSWRRGLCDNVRKCLEITFWKSHTCLSFWLKSSFQTVFAGLIYMMSDLYYR